MGDMNSSSNNNRNTKNSGIASMWDQYSVDYNTLAGAIETANISAELLRRVIRGAITLDRMNIDIV